MAVVLGAMLLAGGCAGKSAPQSLLTHEDHVKQAELYMTAGKANLALLHYEQALASEPEDADIRCALADALLALDRPDLAVAAYEVALAKDSTHPGAHFGLSRILLSRDDRQGAKTHLIASLERQPQQWRVYNSLGIIYDLDGEYHMALAAFRRASEINPNQADSVNNMGITSAKMGDLPSAEATFRKALRLNRGDKRTLNNLGMVLARQGRHLDALEVFRQASPDHVAHNNLGYACFLQGDFQQAEVYYRKAIELSPAYYETANANLRRLHERENRRDSPALKTSANLPLKKP